MNRVDSDLHSRLMMARLPAMPQILLKLLEKCQSEEVGMSALAELIAKDPGMTCKILGVANSSAYHRNSRKFGLEESLATLGTDMIKTLVISESVLQVFNGFPHTNTTDLRCFWKHSLSAAVMAGGIARKLGIPNVEEAYLAGLLHDVGRLALLSEALTEYAHLFFAPDDDKLCAIEQNLLKLTHAEVGAWLAERWKLDSFLSDSLRYHHEPMERLASAPVLVRIVFLAQLMCAHDDGEPAVLAAGEICGLLPEDLQLIRKGSRKQVAKFAELLGIDLTGADELSSPTDGWNIAGMLAGSDEATESPQRPTQAPNAQQPQSAPRKSLAEEVGNMLLSSHINQSLSRKQDEESALLETIVRSARLLFSFNSVAILRMDQSGKTLVGVPLGEQQNRMLGFSVALASGGTIAESAVQQKTAFITIDTARQHFATEQLLRILESDSLACLPISSGQRCLGVLIGGIASCQIPALQKRERFLKSFAEQTAILFTRTAPTSRNDTSLILDAQDHKASNATREVVHEANNALSIIKNYLGVLDGKLEKKGVVVSELSILHEEIDRVGQIIKGITEPKAQDTTNAIDINRLIHGVARLFNETESSPSPVKITTELLDTPTEIIGNNGTLKQILVNLIKNGVEAMPDGGEIWIGNNGHVNHDGHVYVELSIRDNGPGINHKILDNLFTPGQTTKAGGHRGLGLSIVHSLVKQNGGLISCRSNDRGTAFVILLPAHKRS